MCSSLKLWSAMVRVHAAAFSSSSSPPPLQQGVGPAAGAAKAKPSDDDHLTTTTATVARRRLHGMSDQREVFTIWMKSLVLNGSGCTVYDSTGSVVYRVDNYGVRRAADVCLMDLSGNFVLDSYHLFTGLNNPERCHTPDHPQKNDEL